LHTITTCASSKDSSCKDQFFVVQIIEKKDTGGAKATNLKQRLLLSDGISSCIAMVTKQYATEEVLNLATHLGFIFVTPILFDLVSQVQRHPAQRQHASATCKQTNVSFDSLIKQPKFIV
jgi:hypothetical protein